MYKQHNSITTNRQKITYVSIPEDAARDGMKAAGMDDWFINSMTELYGIIIIRADYASGLSLAVEKITEKKPNLSLSLPEIMQRLLNGINVILANHSLNR